MILKRSRSFFILSLVLFLSCVRFNRFRPPGQRQNAQSQIDLKLQPAGSPPMPLSLVVFSKTPASDIVAVVLDSGRIPGPVWPPAFAGRSRLSEFERIKATQGEPMLQNLPTRARNSSRFPILIFLL